MRHDPESICLCNYCLNDLAQHTPARVVPVKKKGTMQEMGWIEAKVLRVITSRPNGATSSDIRRAINQSSSWYYVNRLRKRGLVTLAGRDLYVRR